MSELLEVNHVSYAYHSIDGETETLADISFHIKEGNLQQSWSERLWKIHAAFTDLRTFKAGKRRNPARWQKHRRRKRADRLYAAERLSV